MNIGANVLDAALQALVAIGAPILLLLAYSCVHDAYKAIHKRCKRNP